MLIIQKHGRNTGSWSTGSRSTGSCGINSRSTGSCGINSRSTGSCGINSRSTGSCGINSHGSGGSGVGNRKIMAILAAVFCLCLSGCSVPAAGKASAYQIDQDKKLILYTSHKEEVYGPIVKEFEERTGIWVEVHAGGTTEVLEAVREAAEQNGAGQSGCDVMFGGGVESYEAYRDCFEQYACGQSEFLDPQYASVEQLWTIFTELPIVFVYNNKLVSEEDAPRSWEEFLGEKWKGRIAFADPRKSGTSYTALATMIQIMASDDGAKGQTPVQPQTPVPVQAAVAEQSPASGQVMAQFVAALDGNISAGSGEVLREVGSGLRLVGITLEETARKEIAAGADIGMSYPVEGTSAVPDGCALVKNAPNPENARLFIDFTVSDDVQKLAADQFSRRSVRMDLSQGQEELPALGKLTIVPFNLHWAGTSQEELLAEWARLLEQSR